jgi:hypothetical protein
MPPEKVPSPELSWLDRLRQRFERFLSGRAPSDPLYLTNRTWVQKLKVAALIAVPILILGALVMVGATDMFHFTKADPYEHPLTEAQPGRDIRSTPDLKLVPTDLEVINIRIAKDENPPGVTGIIRNNTNHKVDSAEVSFYLSDERGSLMGTESTQVHGVGPHSDVPFHAPLKIRNAENVIVREVHSN